MILLKQLLEHIGRASAREVSQALFRNVSAPTDGLKPLPGTSAFYDIRNVNETTFIRAWLPSEKEQLVGELQLKSAYPFHSPDRRALLVMQSVVQRRYRGKGFGKALYMVVLKIMNRTLVAGTDQSLDGRRLWVALDSIPGVEVRGYVSIPKSDLSFTNPANAAKRWRNELTDNNVRAEKIIDTIMGELGARYMGFASDEHYFSFDVVPTTTGNELTAYVDSKLSRIYSGRYSTGLFATWNGK